MNADQLTQFLDQVQRLWDAHVPAGYQVPLYPVAVGMLLVGIGLSVLGAKLARPGITCGFGALGALAGAALAPELDWPLAVVIILGTAIGAVVGYGLFRLWVGLAAAAFLTTLTVGVYGGQIVVPHFIDYEPLHTFDGNFALPSASEEDPAECKLSTVKTWARDFWLYVQSREADVNKRILGIGLVAALAGLLLGALLPRLTLIITSSLVGTVLVMSGLAGLATLCGIELAQAYERHGQIVGAAALIFLSSSLLLQSLLTRKAPRPAPPPADG